MRNRINVLMALYDVEDKDKIRVITDKPSRVLCPHNVEPLTYTAKRKCDGEEIDSVDIHEIKMTNVQIKMNGSIYDLGLVGKCSCGKFYITER